MKKRRFWSASLSLILILALCLGLSACGQSGGDTASTEGRTDLVYCLGGDIICRYVIQQDINKIALDLREAHKDDFFSVPEDNPLEDFLQTAEETAREDSDPEQAALAFICKRLKLNYKKLSEEEKKWLKKIAQKPDLLKTQRRSGEESKRATNRKLAVR